METRAVIDRIEGTRAVLLVGEEEEKALVPVSRLPARAGEGDWLIVSMTNGQITGIQPDPEQTEKRRRLIEAKLELLRKKKQT
ncbi:MAG: DUF3006 domain-containing protein [Chloroflexi bacterium]|nr:DUF3006 domain-containing protein [Chloroflexota bacterium]